MPNYFVSKIYLKTLKMFIFWPVDHCFIPIAYSTCKVSRTLIKKEYYITVEVHVCVVIEFKSTIFKFMVDTYLVTFMP